LLSALASVDAVTIFDEPTPRELVSALLPDVLVKGGDWGPDEIVGREEFDQRDHSEDYPAAMIIPFVEQAIRPLEESQSLRVAVLALEERLRQAASVAKSEVTLAGLTDTAKALTVALVGRTLARPVLLLTTSNRRAETLVEPLRFFASVLTGRPESAVVVLPSHDVSPYRGLSPHPAIAEARAVALWRLATGEAEAAVVPIGAALGRLANREVYAGLGRTVHPREIVEQEELIAYLEGVGYERAEPVEMAGQYSVRGGIVDVFPPESQPVRLEFFGDTVEELRVFDPATQRSTAPVVEATFLPLVETRRTPELITRLWEVREGQEAEGEVTPFPGWEFLLPLAESFGNSLLDLAPRAVVLVDEPQSLRAEAAKLWEQMEEEHSRARAEKRACAAPGEFLLRWPAFEAHLSTAPRLHLEQLALEITGADHIVLSSQPTARFRGAVRNFVEEVRQRLRRGGPVLVASATTGEMERMAEILSEYGVAYRFASPTRQQPEVVEQKAALPGEAHAAVLVRGTLPEGVSFPALPLTLFGNYDLFERVVPAAARPKSKAAAFAADIGELKEGDFVVHVDHGIGEFGGLRQISVDDLSEEFLQINYAAITLRATACMFRCRGPTWCRSTAPWAQLSRGWTGWAASPGSAPRDVRSGRCARWRGSCCDSTPPAPPYRGTASAPIRRGRESLKRRSSGKRPPTR
jgi:transcription-repair coupling factor (superfamily II helicase)